LSEENQLQLSRALTLARELGAEVITAADSDIVKALLRTASQRNITQIIVGKRAGESRRKFFRKDRWLDRLLEQSGAVEVRVVPFKEETPENVLPFNMFQHGSTLQEYLWAAGIMFAACWLLTFTRGWLTFQVAAWVFITIVVIMAAYVGRGATLLATLMSALLWDYYFEPPYHSFDIEGTEDKILFALYFVIALVLGHLTTQIRRQERAERDRQERAEALQMLTREVTGAIGLDDMLNRAAKQTAGVFKAEVAILLASTDGPLHPHPASTFQVPAEESRLPQWVFDKGSTAGKFTGEFPLASALYLPLAAYGERFGVLGVRPRGAYPPGVHQRNLMDAFAEQIALAMHRFKMREISENAKVLAESERLSKTLLNSISHEIRTPLTVISGAAAFLLDFEKTRMSDTQNNMVEEIHEATERLNRLVGKVFEITRLESGHLKPQYKPCEVSELIQMAEDVTRREMARHKLKIEIAPDLPMVPMDFELILRSVANLFSNAAFHTPPGTEVQVKAKLEVGYLLLVVADRGPGIPPEAMPHLFEKFYRAPDARTGGTGLGLALVKGFVEAHGGRVAAENRAPGGAAFSIRLPLRQPQSALAARASIHVPLTERAAG
jgi:two-component system sensor histidine kinase KdpD